MVVAQATMYSIWPIVEHDSGVDLNLVKSSLLELISTLPPRPHSHATTTTNMHEPAEVSRYLSFLARCIESATSPHSLPLMIEDHKPNQAFSAQLPPLPPTPPSEATLSPSPPSSPLLSAFPILPLPAPTLPRKQSPTTTSQGGGWQLTDHYLFVPSSSTWHCQHPRCLTRNATIAPGSAARKFGVYQAPRFATSSINKRAREHWEKHVKQGEVDDDLVVKPIQVEEDEREEEEESLEEETRWWKHGKKHSSPTPSAHTLPPPLPSTHHHRPAAVARSVRGVLRENLTQQQKPRLSAYATHSHSLSAPYVVPTSTATWFERRASGNSSMTLAPIRSGMGKVKVEEGEVGIGEEGSTWDEGKRYQTSGVRNTLD